MQMFEKIIDRKIPKVKVFFNFFDVLLNKMESLYFGLAMCVLFLHCRAAKKLEVDLPFATDVEQAAGVVVVVILGTVVKVVVAHFGYDVDARCQGDY